MFSLIDVEDQSILSNIFKDAFEESWKENPEFTQYLAELSSFGVDKLSREPERIAEERGQILQQTQELAFHNYKTFIQTAECSRNIFQDFQIIEQRVEQLLKKLPELHGQCNTFMTEAQDVTVSRRMNTITLGRHTQLLEVLEIPQLMDTCVRNSYYEEALELAAHVRRLEKKHANIPIIATIVKEVQGCSRLMLGQLLQQLRSNVQLPVCLRVIGYLRRMDTFSEPELRIKFLQARDAWFQSILDGITKDDAYYHLTKTIEASRVHLFDIITQYRAIFSDEDPLLTAPQDDSLNESALFHGWVVQKISQFIQTLESDLSRGVGGRLDSLLGQCMYFGLSFSRVGADFRGLIAPIFQKTALYDFTEAVREADQRLSESLQSYTLLSAPNTSQSKTYSGVIQQTSSVPQPPLVLMQYPPVAVYCNMLLTAMNDLRLCAPLSLACSVSQCICDSLKKAVQAILAYHRAEEPTLNAQEHERFSILCGVVSDEFVPFINQCVQTLFPPGQICQALGITLSDLSKLGYIGCLDSESIVGPLSHLIPAKPVVLQQVKSEPEQSKDDDVAEELAELDMETNPENLDLPSDTPEVDDLAGEEGASPGGHSDIPVDSESEVPVDSDSEVPVDKIDEPVNDTDDSASETNLPAEPIS